MTILKFIETFSSNDLCLAHLSTLKWGDGFVCTKCKCNQFTKGYQAYSRRCKNCRYEESVTANTLFHNVKFSLKKAFLICYRMSTKKGMSSYEVAKEVGVTQKTAWLFCTKLRDAMQSSGKHLLSGKVHVDECVIGGKEKGMPGRSLGKKKAVLVMLEVRSNNKIGRIYVQTIKDYKKETIYPVMKSCIKTDASVVTDQYVTYEKLGEEFENTTQVKSCNGKNFKEMHQQIMNLKGGLRGIHHKCSQKHMQGYLNQYCYRTNRRSMKNPIVLNLIKKSLTNKAKNYPQIKAMAA